MNCKNFSPNIFNQTKCQNCFKFKDVHSLEALEKNRATRKMEKCGYLFVAPDWDFSLPVNRTKRWQRRWFTLYDDGELTYSLDEHPDTLPQGVIDMNKVLEIHDAEQATGNDFSISLETAEKIHYIKGTSKEEKKWWFDVLVRYPKLITRCSRFKRNTTLPSTVTILENKMVNKEKMNECPKEASTRTASVNCNLGVIKLNNSGDDVSNLINTHASLSKSYSKINGCDVDLLNAINKSKRMDNAKSSLPLRETNNLIPCLTKDGLSLTKSGSLIDINSNDKIKNDDPLDYGKLKSRRYLKKETKGVKSQRSRSDGVAKMIPPLIANRESKSVDSVINGSLLSLDLVDSSGQQNSVYYLVSKSSQVKKLESLEDIAKSDSPTVLPRRRSEKIEDLARKFQSNEICKENQSNKPQLYKSKSMVNLSYGFATHRYNYENKNDLKITLKETHSVKNENNLQARGDPDGHCLDSIITFSPNSEFEYKQQDVFVKKGWLLRLGHTKEWFKHWFVLRNNSLTYFRDPTAEDSGILDGVIDFGLIKSVSEIDSDQNYAFALMMWDDKQHILAAITSCLRSNWMEAIKSSASLTEQRVNTESSLITNSIKTNSDTPNDNSSDDPSEYFSVIDDEDEYKILPPSPPINRTAISKVKEKARSRSTSRSRAQSELEDASQNQDSNKSSKLSDNDQNQPSSLIINKMANDEPDHPSYDSLINKYNDLKKRLDEKQKDDHFKTKYECLKDKYEEERAKWKQLMMNNLHGQWSALNNNQDVANHSNRLIDYKDNLKKSSNVTGLNCNEFIELYQDFEFMENEERKSKKENEVSKLKMIIKDLENLCQTRLNEIEECNKKIAKLRSELEAKEELFHRCELEKDKIDHQLCNTVKSQIKERAEASKAMEELKANVNRLKERLKQLNQDVHESNINYDYLEIAYNKLNNSIKDTSKLHQAELDLMKDRVNDLTQKLTVSEKGLRQAKLKITKYEAKQERRRNTLRGKEYNLSKDFEIKLQELENKITGIQIILLGNEQHSLEHCPEHSALEALPPSDLDLNSVNVPRKCHKETDCQEPTICSPIH